MSKAMQHYQNLKRDGHVEIEYPISSQNVTEDMVSVIIVYALNLGEFPADSFDVEVGTLTNRVVIYDPKRYRKVVLPQLDADVTNDTTLTEVAAEPRSETSMVYFLQSLTQE